MPHPFFTKYRCHLRWLFIVSFPVLISVNLCGQVTALTTANPVVPANTLDVHFLNVGQGNCVLVKFPSGRFMLYDAGTTSSKNTIDKSQVAARVAAITGGAQITTVILSHPDKDHINIVPLITGALHPLFLHYSGDLNDYRKKYFNAYLAGLTVATTLVSYPPNYPPIPVNTNPSTQIDCGPGAQVYIIAASVLGDGNTGSIVIKIVYQGVSVLLTGDATAVTEEQILGKWPAIALKSTVILFSHHGSNHSSIPAFIGAVSANIGVWSASATHMGYGHPRCDVMAIAESMVDSTTKNGVTIQPHSISCFNSATRTYDTSTVWNAFFLTARQGDILFRSDGTYYTVIVTTL